MDIDTLINEKIEADADFQESLVVLSEEEQAEAINQKKSEILAQEFSSLKEKADKAEKADELVKNYKIRAEKAEAELKGKGGNGQVPKEELSPRDLYALMDAKVPQEHLDEVIKGAKILGLEVADALKDPMIKLRLKTLAEFDETSKATNRNPSRVPSKKVAGEEIQRQVSTGEVDKIPAKGSAEAEELFYLRRGVKR